jgi:anti-anti-sigma regulatory factor
MLAISVDKVNDLTVIECRGKLVGDESVFRLRDFVLAQEAARTILLDLSEVKDAGCAAVEMLASLDRCSRAHNIDFELFSPSKSVMKALQNGSTYNFKIVSFRELQVMMRADHHYPLAA